MDYQIYRYLLWNARGFLCGHANMLQKERTHGKQRLNPRSLEPPQPCSNTIHYGDVIMGTIASQITSLTIGYSDADHRKHQSSASLACVWRIHRRPVNSPHKWPVTRKMFPFDDVIMPGKSSTRRLSHLHAGIRISNIERSSRETVLPL